MLTEALGITASYSAVRVGRTFAEELVGNVAPWWLSWMQPRLLTTLLFSSGAYWLGTKLDGSLGRGVRAGALAPLLTHVLPFAMGKAADPDSVHGAWQRALFGSSDFGLSSWVNGFGGSR